MTANEIANKYGLISYRNWNRVPEYLHTRTSALREKVVIPEDAKPDAVKNSSSALTKDRIYFLYDLRKYKSEEWTQSPNTWILFQRRKQDYDKGHTGSDV